MFITYTGKHTELAAQLTLLFTTTQGGKKCIVKVVVHVDVLYFVDIEFHQSF